MTDPAAGTANAAETAKKSAYRQGEIIFGLLAVLTLVEYLIGAFTNLPIVLILLGVVKAALVLHFFMHIGRVFASDDDAGGH